DTCAPMSDDPTPPKRAAQIDDDVVQGAYSNVVLLNHTENEIVLDCAFIQPNTCRAEVRTRVISSPRRNRRPLGALRKQRERYDVRYGRIELPPDDEPILH